MSRPFRTLGFVAVALLVTTAAPVSAQRLDKLTYLTFSGPVQVPGLTLGAGTYRFQLANADSGRNVIRIVSNDGYYVYTAFHTMPDYRSTVTEESTVTFMEAPVGVAPPVKSLFYSGETSGYAFFYPRGEPNLTPPPALAQPPISYAPLDVVAPSVATAAEPTAAARATAATAGGEPLASEPVSTTAPEPTGVPDLPATASPLPLVGLGGIASLVLGLAVSLLRRRVA